MMKIVVVSGGFDPIHSGHIEYFKSAKNLGNMLIVALNSDSWLKKKKGKFFMPYDERESIISSIKYVDEVIDFKDDHIGSCLDALKQVKKNFPNDEIYFANGGDRNKENIPEMQLTDINFIFNVGGSDKKNSSSWILDKWKYYFEERQWGSFFNLFETKNIKVKELIIEPGASMSLQRHHKRSELWLVSEGSCVVNYISDISTNTKEKKKLKRFTYFHVPVNLWHQITNPYKRKARIIEIQYGDQCIESDIERLK
mgnify:FL=1